MFRFIHTADTHIDSPLRGLEAYDGAQVEALRGATRRAFENLVRLALDEAVDFIVIAGDLYDGDWKDFSTGLFFTRQMARLREAGVPVYVIAGNHDAASVLTRRLSLPDNVHFFSTRAAESKQVPDLPVVIHGRGFPHRAVPENLVPDYPEPVSGLFNVGLLHSSLNGAPGHDTYAPCTLRDLTDKGYDYWALGHVHQPQVLARDPWVVYPGNLQGRHIRETGARGCQLVSVSDSLEVIDAEHRPLDLVRWQRISVDLSAADRVDQAPSNQPPSHQPRFDQAISLIGDALRAALPTADGRLLAVRITLSGATALHGKLKRNQPRLRAECIAQGQMIAPDELWIEEIEIDTMPRYQLAELGARDDLTRIVLETLDGALAGELDLPADAQDALKQLPADIRTDIEADLAPAARAALLGDVRAIVLEALQARGGQDEDDPAR
jgi:DNA repair protein SbcD/Mre11